jgi:hypothetical protein
MTSWTLDGREEIVGLVPFIIRSCPHCHAERFAKREDLSALDALRNWALGHGYSCPAARGTRAKGGTPSWGVRTPSAPSTAHSILSSHGREPESVSARA